MLNNSYTFSADDRQYKVLEKLESELHAKLR